MVPMPYRDAVPFPAEISLLRRTLCGDLAILFRLTRGLELPQPWKRTRFYFVI
jgi:hypothetical protein